MELKLITKSDRLFCGQPSQLNNPLKGTWPNLSFGDRRFPRSSPSVFLVRTDPLGVRHGRWTQLAESHKCTELESNTHSMVQLPGQRVRRDRTLNLFLFNVKNCHYLPDENVNTSHKNEILISECVNRRIWSGTSSHDDCKRFFLLIGLNKVSLLNHKHTGLTGNVHGKV